MRQLYLIALLFLCLNTGYAQTTILDKKVTLKVTNVTLENALVTLQKRYHVHFSYANNLIPLQQKVSISATNQPLESVLKQLLTTTSVSFQVVGKQIVLRHETLKPPATHTEETYQSRKTGTPPVSNIQRLEPVTASTPGEPSKDIDVVPVPVPTKQLTRQERRRMRLQALSTQVQEKVQEATQTLAETVPKGGTTGRKARKGQTATDKTTAQADLKTADVAADSGNTAAPAKPVPVVPEAASEKAIESKTDTMTVVADTSTAETRLCQVTLVPPIGSNGMEAGKIVNQLSINIIAGYARGLRGVEFGGVANLEKEEVDGVQFAGFLNTVGGSVSGVQFAGFANLTRGHADGVQFAGFLNATRGNITTGGQFGGFINIAGGNVSVVQAAGFINVARRDVKGVQMAGFINTTRGHVEGAQLAGFINLARRVKGVQIGVINIADSVEGVQIGLLSFARNGYRRLEVWGGEALYAHAAFKMGTSYFHNIFSVGYRWEGSRSYVGLGYGIGTELPLSNRLAVNLDAICWQIAHEDNWFQDLNLLNQLRANLSFRLGKRTALFAGPTYNVYVTDVRPESNVFALPVPDWAWYDHSTSRTRVAMWIGANAGVRF